LVGEQNEYLFVFLRDSPAVESESTALTKGKALGTTARGPATTSNLESVEICERYVGVFFFLTYVFSQSQCISSVNGPAKFAAEFHFLGEAKVQPQSTWTSNALL
jgi:hypothetical protein